MKYVLDTHTWIWWNARPEKLSPKIRDLLAAADNYQELLIAADSIWELAKLLETGRLALSCDPEEWIDFRLMVPQGRQGGSGFDRIDPGSTGSGYDDIRIFMHYMAVNAINIHKRGIGCRRLNRTHNLQAGGLQGFENTAHNGLEPIRLRGPDDQSFFAEFCGKFSGGPIQYTAAERITIPFKLL